MRWRTSLSLGAVAGFAAGLIGVTMVELTRPAEAVQAGPVTVDFHLNDAAGKAVTPKDFAGKWLLIDLDQPGCACDRQARIDTIGQAMKLMGRRGRELSILVTSPDPASGVVPVADSERRSLTGPPTEFARLRQALVAPDLRAPLLVLLHADGSLDRTIEGPIDGEQMAKDLLKYLTRGY